MVPSIMYFLVSTCLTSSWSQRLRAEKIGRFARSEVDGPDSVPRFDSLEGLQRTKTLHAKIQEEIEATLYDHPLRSPSLDRLGGCNYLHEENPPDFGSSQPISLLPPDFYTPRSTAAFFETLRDRTSSSSFQTPFIPKDVELKSIIPDRIVKKLILMLIRDFVPIYSLDCYNVTTFPLPSMDEAKLLAGVNIQAFTEELKKYPFQMLLVSWWLPSLGQYLPPKEGSAVIEAISRHNNLVVYHQLHGMNNDIRRNQNDVNGLREEFLGNDSSASPASGIGINSSTNFLERPNTLIEEYRISFHGPLEKLTKKIESRTSSLEDGITEIKELRILEKL